jgi:NAD(P)-dependent dehydrogenase (short-subunit alcohol dehydrogenase family)
MRFTDKVVVITGAASGLGFVTAKAFAREGAQVVITDLASDAVEAAVGEIEAEGGCVMGLTGDVSNPDHVQANVDAVMQAFGRIDVLVNNAGIIRRAPAEAIRLEDWRQVISVNLDGTFYWSQAVAVRSMIPRQSGAIVNVASIGGMVAFPTAVSYTASKAAVIGLTKGLAIDWAQYKIRVNAICPGMTWGSNLSKAELAKNPNHFIDREPRIPLGQAAQPEEQANCVLFLASNEASYVHGLIMNVDGGQVALSSGHNTPRQKVEALVK